MKNKPIFEIELNKAKNNKLLSTYRDNNSLYELNQENVINIETMLIYNPRYSNFDYEEIDNAEIFNNQTCEEILEEKSSTYLITLIKKGLKDKMIFDNYPYGLKEIDENFKYNLIFHILKRINKENSTRVSIEDIKRMTEVINDKCYIKNKKTYSIAKLWNILENIKTGYNLIAELTVIKDNNENFSLATKFCHYMCINYFNDSETGDNYSIYDNVVADSIQKYFEYYEQKILEKYKDDNEIIKYIKKRKFKNAIKDIEDIKDKQKVYKDFYIKYQTIIDHIIEIASIGKKKISRNGFDHLLWYTNK